jgi:hypothetical protein
MLAREDAVPRETANRPAEPAAAAPPKPRLWNSLELSRLVMSAATPLMIFAMGAYLSYQSSQQAAARDRADKAAAAQREALDRAADTRAQQQRRLEDRAREDAIRADTIAREQAAQEAQLRFSHQTQLYAKRIEIWDQLGPVLLDANQAVDALGEEVDDPLNTPSDFPERRAAMEKAGAAFDAAYARQQHYFSAGFQQEVAKLRQSRGELYLITKTPVHAMNNMQITYDAYLKDMAHFKAALEQELGLTDDAIRLR